MVYLFKKSQRQGGLIKKTHPPPPPPPKKPPPQKLGESWHPNRQGSRGKMAVCGLSRKGAKRWKTEKKKK